MADTTDQTDIAPPAAGDASAAARLGGRLAVLQLLAIRDYRLLLLSNSMSFAGFQIRTMGQAWVALQMTDSNLWVGIVNASPVIASLSLTAFAGVMADRFDRRTILVRVRFVVAIFAFLTAFLITSGVLELWHLVLIGVGVGAATAFNAPASQTLALDIAGRARMMTAVSLTATVSNVAMIAGPAAGGVLLATVGMGSIFYLLGGMYTVGLIANIMIKTRTRREGPARPVTRDLKAGLDYVWRTRHVRWLIVLGMSSIFAGMFPALIPVYSRDILGVGEIGYGTLLAVEGAGALVGSIGIVLLGDIRRKSLLLLAAMLTYDLAMVVFGVSRIYEVSLVATFLLGLATAGWMTSVFTLLQTSVDPAMRGRVTGVFMMTTQLFGLGWLLGGALGDLIGPTQTILLGAGLTLTVDVLAFARSPELRRL